MKRKATAVLAVACGLVCAVSVYAYMRSVQADALAARNDALAKYGGDSVEACVATSDIMPGEELGPANTAMRPWLVQLLPSDAVLSAGDVRGERAGSLIVAGEVVSTRRLEGDTQGVHVPMGLQAISVDLGAAQAIAELIKPASIVDVYASGPNSTTLIAHNTLVAAVEPTASGARRVTLAVAPEHVQETIAAAQQSSIYLAMPARGDATSPDPSEQVPEEPSDTDTAKENDHV